MSTVTVTLSDMTNAAKALETATSAAKVTAKALAKALEAAKAETSAATTSAAKAETAKAEAAIAAKAEALATATETATSAAKALASAATGDNVAKALEAAKALETATATASEKTGNAGRPKKNWADWNNDAAKVTSAGIDALAKALATTASAASVAKAWKHPTEKMAVDVSVSFSVDGVEYAGKYYMTPETDTEKLKETATKAQLAAKNALAYGQCVGALAMAIFAGLADGKITAKDTGELNTAVVTAMAGNIPTSALVVTIASGDYLCQYDAASVRWNLEK